MNSDQNGQKKVCRDALEFKNFSSAENWVAVRGKGLAEGPCPKSNEPESC